MDINLDKLSTNMTKSRQKYDRIIKKCPVCDVEFISKKGHIREKITCSHSCSNTYFRSGENNPNWKTGSGNLRPYRKVCFRYHAKKCVVCSENKIVAVHHFDLNHKNDEPKNLIPLCPTHHMYVHSKYKNEVEDKIITYRNSFIEKFRTG